MPNGGTDCCGNCVHNRAVQEMGHLPLKQGDKFRELSYCELHNARIPNPFWTYCENFLHRKPDPVTHKETLPTGWIWACGLYEGYVRIPWHGHNEPHVYLPTNCVVCGRQTKEGIEIQDGEQAVGFCTNRHYVQWWKSKHDDDRVTLEGLATPEEFYKKTSRRKKNKRVIHKKVPTGQHISNSFRRYKMAKRKSKLAIRIPPYRAPRNSWRREIHKIAFSAAQRAGVSYKPFDKVQLTVRLYLDDRGLYSQDVDNRLKDIMDALQGRAGGSKKIRTLSAIIPNDNQIFRIVLEKSLPPKQSKGVGHLIVTKYGGKKV